MSTTSAPADVRSVGDATPGENTKPQSNPDGNDNQQRPLAPGKDGDGPDNQDNSGGDASDDNDGPAMVDTALTDAKVEAWDCGMSEAAELAHVERYKEWERWQREKIGRRRWVAECETCEYGNSEYDGDETYVYSESTKHEYDWRMHPDDPEDAWLYEPWTEEGDARTATATTFNDDASKKVQEEHVNNANANPATGTESNNNQ